jgi:hypothetical protein
MKNENQNDEQDTPFDPMESMEKYSTAKKDKIKKGSKQKKLKPDDTSNN